MSTTISDPLVEFIGGKRYFSWEVVQTDISAADRAVIEDVPTFCTLTLYEMDANEVSTDYALGLVDEFTPSDNDIATIVMGAQPRAFVRNQCRVNIRTAENILVVYSSPVLTPPASANVTTRITVREGHE